MLELNSPINKVRVSIKEHNIEKYDFKKLLKDSKLKNGDNFILAIPLDKIIELIKQVTFESLFFDLIMCKICKNNVFIFKIFLFIAGR